MRPSCPTSHVADSGELPFTSAWLTSAPRPTNSRAHASWPCSQAVESGVSPPFSDALASAPPSVSTPARAVPVFARDVQRRHPVVVRPVDVRAAV